MFSAGCGSVVSGDAHLLMGSWAPGCSLEQHPWSPSLGRTVKQEAHTLITAATTARPDQPNI